MNKLDVIPQSGYIRKPQLRAFFNCGPNTIDGWVKTGNFPKPIRLGKRYLVWRCEDIHSYLKMREQEVGGETELHALEVLK